MAYANKKGTKKNIRTLMFFLARFLSILRTNWYRYCVRFFHILTCCFRYRYISEIRPMCCVSKENFACRYCPIFPRRLLSNIFSHSLVNFLPFPNLVTGTALVFFYFFYLAHPNYFACTAPDPQSPCTVCVLSFDILRLLKVRMRVRGSGRKIILIGQPGSRFFCCFSIAY